MRTETPIRHPLSHAERFYYSKNNKGESFAPLTHGSPANMTHIDFWVFKKTPHERTLLKEMKKELPKSRNHSFVTMFKGQF